MSTTDAPPPAGPRERARRGGGPLGAWSALTSAQQRTAVAAIVVLISLQAPWYTETLTPVGTARATITENTISALGAFSLVEAAVLLVGGAVLALTWGRATGRRFSLPFADGTLVVAAAGWVGLLVVYRLFDRPDTEIVGQVSRSVGLHWGIFASLAAVGLLLACGLDQRRGGVPRRAPATPRAPRVDPAAVVVDRDEAPERPVRRARPARPVPPTEPETRAARPRERRRPAAPAADADWDVPDTIVERPRRPRAADDETRALGRSEATRLLRESGIDTGAPPAAGAGEGPRRPRPPRRADDD